MSQQTLQETAYNVLSEFAVEALVGVVSNIYKKLGADFTFSNDGNTVIVNFTQLYFNEILKSYYRRSDEYVIEKINRIDQLGLGKHHGNPEYSPQEILELTLELYLYVLSKLEMKPSYHYESDMETLKTSAGIILSSIKSAYCSKLVGCRCNSEHATVSDEEVFKIRTEKWVPTELAPSPKVPAEPISLMVRNLDAPSSKEMSDSQREGDYHVKLTSINDLFQN